MVASRRGHLPGERAAPFRRVRWGGVAPPPITLGPGLHLFSVLLTVIHGVVTVASRLPCAVRSLSLSRGCVAGCFAATRVVSPPAPHNCTAALVLSCRTRRSERTPAAPFG
jgi:hypothetical protein